MAPNLFRYILPAIATHLFLAPASTSADAKRTFEADVRPILKAHCFHCHGEEGKTEGNLDVRLVRLLVAGGDSGAALAAGKAGDSYLIERLESGEMPPGEKKVSAEELRIIREWIDQGALTARPEPANADQLAFTEEERAFWSFQPVVAPPIPQVKAADRVRTPVDAFVLARLEREGFRFSPDADKRTLIRRAYFDLLGLPPSPEEVDAFLADDDPQAWPRLLDRLLDSEHYGERWARHWLDVAGYADSDGYSEQDRVRESAWKYRDYVIRSLNADKPFDQFLVEQLAGDELVARPYRNLSDADKDRLIATGFLRNGPDGTGDRAVNQDIARNEVVADTINIVSTSLLGLSVGCARCHSHRFDPITHVVLLFAEARDLVVVVAELVLPVLAVVVVDLVFGVDFGLRGTPVVRLSLAATLDSVEDLVLDLDRFTLEVADLLDLAQDALTGQRACCFLGQRRQSINIIGNTITGRTRFERGAH